MMNNMGDLMKKAQQMQEQMQKAHKRLQRRKLQASPVPAWSK